MLVYMPMIVEKREPPDRFSPRQPAAAGMPARVFASPPAPWESAGQEAIMHERGAHHT